MTSKLTSSGPPSTQNTGSSKGAIRGVRENNADWETDTSIMPHFASFGTRDRAGHEAHITNHPYASANGRENFISVNEKRGQDIELPTFLSYVPVLPLCPVVLPHVKSRRTETV